VGSSLAEAGSLPFDHPDLLAWLEAADGAALDRLDYGVVGMDRDGLVLQYNRAESALAGLSPATVLGQHFFTGVAPCTNNALLAGRFALEPRLDASIDYVFSLRMRPTPVQLRLLQAPACAQRYLLVQPR
jgi:photoactive yellow protein